ncbi:MAG: DedA protein, partial [uncultured Acidimicrobiales bacterium]
DRRVARPSGRAGVALGLRAGRCAGVARGVGHDRPDRARRGRAAGGRVPRLPAPGRPADHDAGRGRGGDHRRLGGLRDRQAPGPVAASEPAGPMGGRRPVETGRGLPGPPRRPGRLLRALHRRAAGHGAHHRRSVPHAVPHVPAVERHRRLDLGPLVRAHRLRGRGLVPQGGGVDGPGEHGAVHPRPPGGRGGAGRPGRGPPGGRGAHLGPSPEGATERVPAHRPVRAPVVLCRPAPAAECGLRPLPDRRPRRGGGGGLGVRPGRAGRDLPQGPGRARRNRLPVPSRPPGTGPHKRLEGSRLPGRDGAAHPSHHGCRRAGVVADQATPRRGAAVARRRGVVAAGGGDQAGHPPPAPSGRRHADCDARFCVSLRPGDQVRRLHAHCRLHRVRRAPVVAVEGGGGHRRHQPGHPDRAGPAHPCRPLADRCAGRLGARHPVVHRRGGRERAGRLPSPPGRGGAGGRSRGSRAGV